MQGICWIVYLCCHFYCVLPWFQTEIWKSIYFLIKKLPFLVSIMHMILPGKKITGGIAMTLVTESFVVSHNVPNPKFSQDFGSRVCDTVLLWNFVPKLWSWIIWSRTITHSLGKVRAIHLYFVQKLVEDNWGNTSGVLMSFLDISQFNLFIYFVGKNINFWWFYYP